MDHSTLQLKLTEINNQNNKYINYNPELHIKIQNHTKNIFFSLYEKSLEKFSIFE